MNFTATVDGLTFDQPSLFEAHMKATHKGALKGSELRRGPDRWQTPAARLKPLPLTAAEKEWLGVWVQLGDGSVGQVWSLTPLRGMSYVVVDGEVADVRLSELTRLADRGPAPEPFRHCAICGEPEGSVYAKPCCDDDQMLDA